MPLLKTKQAFLLFAALLFFVRIANAQVPLMKHYSVNDGLASNTVYSILSDSKGFLWFCTDAGVSRFDGHKFTNYTLTDGLSDNEMLRVYEDSKNRIWFLGFNGTLSYYNNGKFFNPGNDSLLKQAIAKTSYYYFFEDNEKKLWFVNENGYTVVDGKKVKMANLDSSSRLSGEGIIMNSTIRGGVQILTRNSSNTDPFHLVVDDKTIVCKTRYTKKHKEGFGYLPDGSVLFRADEGIILQKDTTQKLVLALGEEFDNVLVNAIFMSGNSRLWLATIGNGLFCYDYNDLTRQPEHYLSNKYTCDIREDLEGNIWTGTLGDGVYMLPRAYKSVKNYTPDNGYAGAEIFTVTKQQGSIYAGLSAGKVAMIDHNTVKLSTYSASSPYNRILRIGFNGSHLWLASDEYLLQVNRANNTVCKMAYDDMVYRGIRQAEAVKDISISKGILCACLVHGIWQTKVSEPDECATPLHCITPDSKRTYCVHIDRRGNTWYGAQGGLYSYDGRSNNHHTLQGLDETLRISCIAETADSELVLATYGYGVFLYKNGKITDRLSTHEGLSSNICKKVFVNKDEIFVSTNNGATVVKYNNGRFGPLRKYTKAEGLLSDDVNDIFADDSEICFATSDGLSVIDRYLATDIPNRPPPVYISNISHNGTPLDAGSHYNFPFVHNLLHFDFTAVSYQYAKDIKYQYRLSEKQQWQETGNNSLDFPSLSPGKYQFQLRARILNGPWSDVKKFAFTVDAPFWKTPWFFALEGLAFILIVSLIANSRIRAAKRKHEEAMRINEQVAHLEQQALQAMMNPHFIFNVMNSIQHYINNHDRHEANQYLSDFARLIRMNLDISSKRYIPLDDEVAYLKLYLSLESLRFGERLTYEVNVDPSIDGDETMIPVMLLQPYIENAIWHGIMPKKENGHVQVDIKKQDNLLKIEITDNGVGMPREQQNGMKWHESKGMKMTRQRLDLISRISGHQLLLSIHDAFPGQEYRGTKIALTLPADLA